VHVARTCVGSEQLVEHAMQEQQADAVAGMGPPPPVIVVSTNRKQQPVVENKPKSLLGKAV
jgi:hypothetical protein